MREPHPHAPIPNSTPEVLAAYWGTYDATRWSQRVTRNRVIVIVAIWLLLISGAAVVGAVKVNQKTSDIQTQVTCETHAVNGGLKDAIDALMGDRNPNDYTKPGPC